MAYDPNNDRRLDRRNRAILAALDQPMLAQEDDVASREEALNIVNAPSALAAEQAMSESLEVMDDESLFPSEGLDISYQHIASNPDHNELTLKVVRPSTTEKLPCVIYIHGGAMMITSYELGHYRAWSRALAQQGLCVVMVDFRNSLRPSTAPDVAPYPAGLNDCVSAFQWVRDNASELNIDADSILIAGDSGGGNLAIATTMKLIKHFNIKPLGLYALCPFILGQWPDKRLPSTIENEGVLISVHNNFATMAYGIDAFNQRDPLAWPGFATPQDVSAFPPTVISVNECDPLRDEGVEFYRLLQEAGVRSHCRQMMGTVHANEMFTAVFPDLTRMTARDIKGWVDECQLMDADA